MRWQDSRLAPWQFLRHSLLSSLPFLCPLFLQFLIKVKIQKMLQNIRSDHDMADIDKCAGLLP